MEFLQRYGKEIVSLCVPLLSLVLNNFFRNRARLVQGTPHTFFFKVERPLVDAAGKVVSPTQSVKTRSLLIANTGRETASNVEIIFNWKPPFLNIWPPRNYEEVTAPDKRHILKFSSMAPNEILSCELFAVNEEIPELVVARCDQCVAENIEMVPQQLLPLWQRRILAVLVLLGMGAAVYSIIVLIQLLVLRTPVGHS